MKWLMQRIVIRCRYRMQRSSRNRRHLTWWRPALLCHSRSSTKPLCLRLHLPRPALALRWLRPNRRLLPLPLPLPLSVPQPRLRPLRWRRLRRSRSRVCASVCAVSARTVWAKHFGGCCVKGALQEAERRGMGMGGGGRRGCVYWWIGEALHWNGRLRVRCVCVCCCVVSCRQAR
jgi:hypothetical protein